KPAQLQGKRVTLDTTSQVFAIIKQCREQPDTRFKGVRIDIGEGENTVSVRFQDRAVTARMIEGAVNSLRSILGEEDALVNVTIKSGIEFATGFDLKEFAK